MRHAQGRRRCIRGAMHDRQEKRELQGCGGQWDGKEKAPVGSLPTTASASRHGGQVWEWTQDCYNDSYSGALTDGSAWIRRRLQSSCCARWVLVQRSPGPPRREPRLGLHRQPGQQGRLPGRPDASYPLNPASLPLASLPIGGSNFFTTLLYGSRRRAMPNFHYRCSRFEYFRRGYPAGQSLGTITPSKNSPAT